jgi:hypothetical protein
MVGAAPRFGWPPHASVRSGSCNAKGPTRRSTPFASLSGRCAMKPRSAGHLERWGSPSVRHIVFGQHKFSRGAFAASGAYSSPCRQRRLSVPSAWNGHALALSIAAFGSRLPLRRRGVLSPLSSPCRQRRLSVPAHSTADAAALPAVASRTSALLGWKEKPVSFGCAPEGAKSGWCAAHRPFESLCRTDDRMKITGCRRVTQSRCSILAVRRGRRIVSADSSPFAVACGGGARSRAFVPHGFPGGVAAQVSGCSVAASVRGPTLRSTPFASLSGRCAMKPRSAGHLERWAS